MSNNAKSIRVIPAVKKDDGEVIAAFETKGELKFAGWILFWELEGNGLSPIDPNYFTDIGRAAATAVNLGHEYKLPVYIGEHTADSKAGKIIGLQLAPFKELEQGSIEIQMDGSDAETKGYGVYSRYENGMAKHAIDFQYESDAVTYARQLARYHEVKIEPYGWQADVIDRRLEVVVDDSKAFESFANKQDFIKDTQRYDFNHPDKSKAGQYGHYDTKNARVMWDGAVAWVLALLGRQGLPLDYLNGGDIRVVVMGRTGVGKSALCGLLADKLRTLGIPVTWDDEAYETAVRPEPWEVLFQEQCIGATVRINEKNLVPSVVYKDQMVAYDNLGAGMRTMIASRSSAKKLMSIRQSAGHEGVSLQQYPDYKQLLLVRQAVENYLSPNLFYLEGTEEERLSQFETIKRTLIAHVWGTFPGVEPGPLLEETDSIGKIPGMRRLSAAEWDSMQQSMKAANLGRQPMGFIPDEGGGPSYRRAVPTQDGNIGPMDDPKYFIRAAVDHFINPNMFNFEADDPHRDTKLNAAKASIVDYLFDTRDLVQIPFERRVRHFIHATTAAQIEGTDYTTKQDDTFQEIAIRAYLQPALWTALAWENSSVVRDYIKTGEPIETMKLPQGIVIKVPRKDDAYKANHEFHRKLMSAINLPADKKPADFYPGPDGDQQ